MGFPFEQETFGELAASLHLCKNIWSKSEVFLFSMSVWLNKKTW
jgi:hypothetical protein